MKSVFFSLMAVILFLCSCQNEYEPGIDPPIIDPPGTTRDSIYLDKMITIEDVTNDTGITIFHYDNLKRVVFISDSIAGKPVTGLSFEYFYSGNDTVPFKSIAYEYDASSTIPDTTLSFFSYDSKARKIRDSVLISGISGTKFLKVTDYNYVAGKVFGQTRFEYLTSPDPTEYNRDTAITDATGNIIFNKKYKLTGGVYVLNITSTFNYDSHPSPFSKLSIFKAHQGFPTGETIITEYNGYNNIISQDETVIVPNNHFKTSNTYVYNNLGLPISESSSYAGFTDKIKFTYRSL